MATAQMGIIVIDDLTGGLNTVDPPHLLGATECQSAINIDWQGTKVGKKRRGSFTAVVTFSSGGPFTEPIGSMVRHVPSTDDTAAEVWAVSGTIFARKAASTQFAQVTPSDAITGNAWDVTWATVDGCLFVAYKSGVNRLHVWDGTALRRTGITPGTNPPTVADQGVGTYPNAARAYRVRWWSPQNVSEPTPVAAVFTPSGAGLSVRVTRPALPNDGETRWILEASADTSVATFYQIADNPIATTFVDDTVLVGAYSPSYTVSPYTGTFQLQKSYRFLAGADNRLIGFGTFQAPGAGVKQNRVEFSDIVGGLTLGALGAPVGRPAESINTLGGWYVDLDESDSGPATGLKGPVFGNYYAFKSHQMWELRPTGDSTRPFAATAISKTIGAVNHQAIIVGEDAQGAQALYFMSHKGPYRYTTRGLEYIGTKIQTLFTSINTFNLDSTHLIAHGIYHPELRQVWFFLSQLDPSLGAQVADPQGPYIYHVDYGGWSRHTLPASIARCSAMLPAVQGAVMSSQLKPHLSYGGNPAQFAIHSCDADESVQGALDGTSPYTSSVMTRPIAPGGLGQTGRVGDPQIVVTGPGATLRLDVVPDLMKLHSDAEQGFGAIAAGNALLTTQWSAILLPAVPTLAFVYVDGLWVFRRFEGAAYDEVQLVVYILSDRNGLTPGSLPWTVSHLVIPVRPMGAVIA